VGTVEASVGDQQAVSAALEASWPVRSAADVVEELIRLVESLHVPGWSFLDAELGGGIDLRAPEGSEPVPLVLADSSVRGTIRRPVQPVDHPGDSVLRLLLQTVVLLVAMERRGWDAIEKAKSAERESRIDPLTGLPNRRRWNEAAATEEARCRRHGLRALVAVVDLDDLKAANDGEGHLAGDVLLRIAGQRLRAAVRDTDLVARVGGDEFAVLAVDADGAPAALSRRLETALAEAGVRASVGVSVVEPDTTVADAYDRADRLMYERKRRRKATASH
jgi:diguanylate cyclase (GGDEF)-like protein